MTDIVGSPNAPYLNSLINTYGYAVELLRADPPQRPELLPDPRRIGLRHQLQLPARTASTQPNLADNIEAAGKTWAGYEAGGGGYTTPTDRLPFLAFTDIYNNPARVQAHLFDLTQLATDLASPATAPNFVWFAADDATNMEGPTDTVAGIVRLALSQLTTHQYNVKAGRQVPPGHAAHHLELARLAGPHAEKRHLHHVRRGLQQPVDGHRQRRQPRRHDRHPVTGGCGLRDARRAHSSPTTTTTTTACSAPSRMRSDFPR